MSRPAMPWYRKSRRMWTITLGGIQTPLGVTDPNDVAGAYSAWTQLIASGTPDAPVAGRTVAQVVSDYLGDPDLGIADKTRSRMKWSLAKFAVKLGKVPVSTLTPRQIETALSDTLSASTQYGAIGDFLTVLSWAGVKPGKVRRPAAESRGADCVLSPTQYEVVKALATGDLKLLIAVLWETGCRPGEASAMTAETVDWKRSQAKIRAHKTRKKTGTDRIIPLTPAALDTLARQRDKYGSGYLFRTTVGKPFGEQRINQRFQWIARRAGFPVFAYMFRHTWATNALEAGVPEAHVAAVLGHGSTAMVAKHYGHLGSRANTLRQAAEQVAAARAG